MMKNPCLFSALIMLQAADKLALNLAVSFADVMQAFGLDEQSATDFKTNY